jgi:hypothetical protein
VKRLQFALIGSALLMIGTASRAQESAAKAPEAKATEAKAPEVKAAEAKAPEAVAPAAKAPEAKEEKKAEGDHPYVDAAVAFLRGLAHSNRSGEAGDQGWEEAKAHAGDTVALKISGKDLVIDLAGKKSDARFLKFSKISTLRDGMTVKGVTAENVQIQVGAEPHSGKAFLMMDEKDGKWRVTSIEVD